MAGKTSGLGMTFTLDNGAGVAKAITNDVSSISVNTSSGMKEITGLDKSAVERMALLADFKCSIKFWWNTDADRSWDVLISTATTAPGPRTLAIGFPGSKTLTAEVLIESCDGDRGDGGDLGYSASFVLQNGTAAAWS